MISAVVLTHNDEKIIERTLKSLIWSDEIVVVDDRSSDGTVAIAKKLNARVYERALNNDFSSQRNFGLEKAKHDWVLFVDSDEEVSPALAKEIKEATGKMDVNGFYLKRQDVLWGRELKHGETSRVRLMRLGQKGKGVWERPIHEVWNITGVVGTLNTPLYHFPHPNVAQFIDEINFYSTINAHYLYSQKIRVPWWHIVVYPKAKFFHNYFLRLGFLDGTAGAVVALMMSMHSFLTRAKLWLLWHKDDRVGV